jgi:single-stranded DNA-binding protein
MNRNGCSALIDWRMAIVTSMRKPSNACTCQAWGDQAETIQRSVTKGAMLFVQGHFTPHQYTTEDGKQAVSLEVNVERFSFADGSKTEQQDSSSFKA